MVYDPEVHLSSLLGANRRFMEQHVPHLGQLMKSELADVIAGSDLLVIGLNDARVFATLSETVRPGQIVLDLVRMPERAKLRSAYEGLCW